MLEPQEHISRALALCERLRSASAQIGPRDRAREVRGADPNELKKILSFLLKHRDMNKLRKLVESLPTSNFAKRSGSTEGYYRNIQSSFAPEFYRLSVDDGVLILGWACRLL